jgi:hypothetical protein
VARDAVCRTPKIQNMLLTSLDRTWSVLSEAHLRVRWVA